MSNQEQKNPKRPLHKRIGGRIVKYKRHFTKYLYERDTVFATIWVFLFIVLLGLIPINVSFLNPLKLGLKDFDFNDMTYAKLGKSANTELDTNNNIVIINVGHVDREVLSWMIEKTAEMKPKVIGLDVLFDNEGENPDPHKDSILRSVLAKYPNLVVTNRLNIEKTKISEVNGFFSSVPVKRGYAHLPNDDPEERKTVREYATYRQVKKDKYYSFGATIVKLYNESAFEKLEKRHKETEQLNYSRHTNRYWVVPPENLLTPGMLEPSLIKGKIVLLGYVNTDPNDIEDKFFTPMNSKYAGKSTPDMNGVVIHANYISMVLENNYIKKLPSWVNYLAAIIICWLHMSFFIRYYLENHIWFHLVAKIAQVISAIFFVYLGIAMYDRFHIKLDMKLSVIVIVMAVDVIYFYEAFAVWMHRKFGFRTVFHQKHH